jgi:hypothetical protein
MKRKSDINTLLISLFLLCLSLIACSTNDSIISVQSNGTSSLPTSPESSANHPPVLNPIGNKTVKEGETLQFTVTGSDPDGNSLSYTAANLPVGASFDGAIQRFTWTPDYGQAGNYSNVHFEVSDGVMTDS